MVAFGSLSLAAADAPAGPPLATGKSKWLGSAHSPPQTQDFAAYFNQVVPENAGKWGSVEAVRDVMNWSELDAAYNLAKDNGWPFRFHILVWGNQQPAWIETLSPAEQLEEIEEWFEAVAKRYPDIDYLEVVNEPLHDPPNRPGSGGGNYINALGGAGTTGWDWLLNAFRMARPLFPNSKLVLNEYSVVNDGPLMAQYIQIINLLKAENLVDVVAEQAHSFTVATTQSSTITANLNTLAATGLPIMITEFDIDGANSTSADDQLQLERYQRVFPLFWEHPSVIGVTLWGFRPGLWRPNAVLVFNDGVERSAFQWLKTYIADSDPLRIALIDEQPVDVAVLDGADASFSVAVSGNPAPTVQWQRSTDNGATWNNVSNDAMFSGATSATLAIDAPPEALNGDQFRALVTNSLNGTLQSVVATLTIVDADLSVITPGPLNVTAGSSTTLEVEVATTAGTPEFQWQRRTAGGTWTDIPGADESEYTIPSMQTFLAGEYRAAVTIAGSTIYAPAITVNSAPAAPSTARLLNLSTRGLSLVGDQVLIPGFVVSGTGSKRLLIRAVGPTLANEKFNVQGTLPDPRMILRRFDFGTEAYVDVTSNDNWADAANAADIAEAIDDLGAFAFESPNEAALLVDVGPGQYTVVADGAGGATGVAIVELYDADAAGSGTRLVNISNRGFAGTGGNVMIPGFSISPGGSKTMLVRVVGPTLAGSPYNVGGTMTDPKLTVYTGTTELFSIDDWEDVPDAANVAEVAEQVGAFPLAAGSADAAAVITLPPGSYTVVGSAANGTDTGVLLVEVYVVE